MLETANHSNKADQWLPGSGPGRGWRNHFLDYGDGFLGMYICHLLYSTTSSWKANSVSGKLEFRRSEITMK